MLEPETLAAAVLVIEKAELMAKMSGVHRHLGCTLEYVTTILTTDDERFRGQDRTDMKWQLFEEFVKLPTMFQVTRDGRWGTRWSTVPPERFNEEFTGRT
jgi:hypothetical protein